MKAKRRAITSSAQPVGAKRMPAVRRDRPAIDPVRTSAKSQTRPTVGSGRDAVVDGDNVADVDLTVDLGRGLVLSNPILVAAGTFGHGVEYADVVEVDRLGAIVCRATTLRPRTGNPPPRMTATPGGLLDAVGLQNLGIDTVLERYASTWAGWRVPVIVNIAGTAVRDYVEVVRRLDGVPGVAGVELNLSSPDAGRGGRPFAVDAAAAAEVTAAVRRATDLPVLVKLSPDVTDIRPIARAVADGGADALTAINTLAGLAVAVDRRGLLFEHGHGGLSGPALKPIALRAVYEVAQAVRIPVVAVGGVTALADVLDFLAVGAVAVQVGTANFADPTLAVRLVAELAAECGRQGHATYRQLIGSALPRRRSKAVDAGHQGPPAVPSGS